MGAEQMTRNEIEAMAESYGIVSVDVTSGPGQVRITCHHPRNVPLRMFMNWCMPFMNYLDMYMSVCIYWDVKIEYTMPIEPRPMRLVRGV
jgi:hypothetical protein